MRCLSAEESNQLEAEYALWRAALQRLRLLNLLGEHHKADIQCTHPALWHRLGAGLRNRTQNQITPLPHFHHLHQLFDFIETKLIQKLHCGRLFHVIAI
jgi:hypothetical protein